MSRPAIFLSVLLLAGCNDPEGESQSRSADEFATAQVQLQLPEFKSVEFQIQSDTPVRQIVVSNAERVYRVGSLTVEELLGDIIKSDPIRDIYDYLSPAVSHKCSNGTFLLEEFRKESVLDRLYSYSFGCCSDVNEPMLSSLYMAAGYEGHSFRSPAHVAIEVCEAGGSPCHYADVDHDMFFAGGIDVARSLHGGIASWFADNRIYKDINGQLRPLAAEGEVIAPTEFLFHKDDSIRFTSNLASDPIMRIYPGETNDAQPGTAVGYANLGLIHYRAGAIDDCVQYEIRFPYVMLNAEVYDPLGNLVATPPARGKYSLSFEVCSTSLDTRIIERPRIKIAFQYNRNIFPVVGPLNVSGAVAEVQY